MATQYVVHHLARVGSTQDEARSRYEGRPCLVTAGAQDAGRGRSGSGWLNATDALAASLAVEPYWPPDDLPLLTLIAGLAARSALGGDFRLKWPNDVVDARDGKVAGILAERQADLVVIGMGVNLFWPDAPNGIAAVYRDPPPRDEALRVAESWATRLLEHISTGPADWDRSGYEQASATIGATVEWDGGGPARAVGVDQAGGLIVESPAGRAVLRSGRVRHIRPTTLSD